MGTLDTSLPRYLSILKKREEPKYRSARRFRVDFDPTGSFDELMDVHDAAMKAHKGGGSGNGGTSLLDLKVAIASRMLDSCQMCERRCGSARSGGLKGRCGVLEARISSEFLHFGEEPELVPSYTIFFAGCTFECVFCQNSDISQCPGGGERFSPEVIVELISRKGSTARNVNWVGGDPTSNLAYILEVLAHSDTRLAQVWNSNMYLTPWAMDILDGVVDVYLTDLKYGNNACGKRFSKVERYWDVITRNHLLARSQSELIIRHLVLPNHVECCSKPVLDWIAANLENVRVNVMGQYRPMYRASEYPDIAVQLKTIEFLEAKEHARSLGLNLVE